MPSGSAAVLLFPLLLTACAGAAGVRREVRQGVAAATAAPADEVAAARFAREVFVAPDGASLVCRIFLPDDLAPSERVPLVLWLHGSGGVGADGDRHLGALVRSWAAPRVATRFRAVVVAPQVPSRSADYRADDDGELAARDGPSMPALLALVDALVRRPDVDPARVYVGGFSMGGSTALAAVVARPRLFAAALSIGGIAPPRDLAATVARVPQLLVHGTADSENPIGPDRAWTAATERAGGRLRLVEYVGLGHDVPADLFASDDWRAWLFAQRR